jgi:hypothetical protein
MVWFRQMGRNGCLLASELASPLHCPMLGVGLLSVDSPLLPLRDCCIGIRGQSILRPWVGHDGDRRCHYVMPFGDGEARTPLSTRGCIELIGGVLENGMQ